MRRRVFLALTLSLLTLPTTALGQDNDVVVFLVRHAERAEDGTNDPPISEEGIARAEMLAGMLVNVGLTHIHSTDYKRTRQTGAPTAEATGLTVQSYNPRDLPGFAEELRGIPGRHLVLGHSNTTPALVQALGGDPHGTIEEMEYNRLYVLFISGDSVRTVLLRFGPDHH